MKVKHLTDILSEVFLTVGDCLQIFHRIFRAEVSYVLDAFLGDGAASVFLFVFSDGANRCALTARVTEFPFKLLVVESAFMLIHVCRDSIFPRGESLNGAVYNALFALNANALFNNFAS